MRGCLPQSLVSSAEQDRLASLAAELPPFPRCGFEVRLGQSRRVDLQQWLTTAEDEPARLREHLQWVGFHGISDTGLDEFLARWGDPSDPLNRDVTELWLELDRVDQEATVASAAISLFIGLDQFAQADTRFATSSRAIDLLIGSARAESRSAVERCFDACPAKSLVSHIGLMVGRPTPFVRINVKRLEVVDLEPYLRDVGWPGSLDEAVKTMTWLAAYADRIAVCLDVGKAVLPQLGFECSFDGQPASNPMWEALLGDLSRRGWCTIEKRDALLSWTGATVPNERTPWPAHLIGAELLRGHDDFSVFERVLGHVKVTIQGGHEPEAKAYFGFAHVWHDAAVDADGPRASDRRVERNGVTPHERALTFLLKSRTASGWWRDFFGAGDGSLEGGSRWSDEWVSAYVAVALGRLADRDARRAALEVWQLLRQRRPPGRGWGFNRRLPPDADSTTWAIRLALAVGASAAPHAEAARAVVLAHLRSDGGASTYLEALCPRRHIAELTPPGGSYEGWFGVSHPCVTAAVATLGYQEPIDFLRRSQAPDGSWNAYWWEERAYTTALAVEAFAEHGRKHDWPRLDAASSWAAGRIDDSGSVDESPFATALCVRVLLAGRQDRAGRRALSRAVSWLEAAQQHDGSWPASARLLVPRADQLSGGDPGAPGTSSLDDARIFTTATVLSAIGDERRA